MKTRRRRGTEKNEKNNNNCKIVNVSCTPRVLCICVHRIMIMCVIHYKEYMNSRARHCQFRSNLLFFSLHCFVYTQKQTCRVHRIEYGRIWPNIPSPSLARSVHLFEFLLKFKSGSHPLNRKITQK